MPQFGRGEGGFHYDGLMKPLNSCQYILLFVLIKSTQHNQFDMNNANNKYKLSAH